MKNFFLPLLMTLLIVSCDNEEITEEGVITEAPNVSKSSEPGSSADNPIVVTARFVDLVRYTVTTCDINNQPNSRPITPLRIRGFFYIPFRPNGGPERFFKETSVDGCFDESRNETFEPAGYKFGVYYEIYGEVVRLARPLSTSAFWFKDIPNSDQVQRVTFSEDGSATFSAPIDFPYEENLDCTGIGPLPSNAANLSIGDRGTRVIHGQTFLFEFVGTPTFKFLGLCEGDDGSSGEDICDGVEPWNRNGTYTTGDQVTYLGFLYERTSRSWKRIGPCGS